MKAITCGRYITMLACTVVKNLLVYVYRSFFLRARARVCVCIFYFLTRVSLRVILCFCVLFGCSLVVSTSAIDCLCEQLAKSHYMKSGEVVTVIHTKQYLETGHTTECIAHAGHSIVFNIFMHFVIP